MTQWKRARRSGLRFGRDFSCNGLNGIRPAGDYRTAERRPGPSPRPVGIERRLNSRGTRPDGLLPPPLRRPHEQAHGPSHRRGA
ncbi:hypothetical protein HMPREF1549_03279 [Actinomyces johnsonii F0510]|uniref:Uncharacterized protein n=1 Tax=Actinomyces johnsonii F0510 TaxID=1227262 RepID=U1PZM5_9ACTO|nr:hypothetical protein HMPREF1549_03279 [Actinomyces johnsonii F0510]